MIDWNIQTQYPPFQRNSRTRTQAFFRPSLPGFGYSQGLSLSCPQAAKKWNISERRVQKLCEENRIPGVSKIGYMWLIPKDAEKPADGRQKNKITL